VASRTKSSTPSNNRVQRDTGNAERLGLPQKAWLAELPANLRDNKHSPEREVRGPVGPARISVGKQRDELLTKLLVFRLFELLAHWPQRGAFDPVQNWVLAGQPVQVGGFPGVEVAPRFNQQFGVMRRRAYYRTT
jgi:hypothetical protein